MRWQGNRESDNVEDMRGEGDGGGDYEGGPGGGGFGGGGGLPPGMMLKGGAGTIIIAIILFLLTGNPLAFLQVVQPGAPARQVQAPPPAAPRPNQPPGAEDDDLKFVKVVLADTEDVWTDLFKRMNRTYRKPHLVMFSGSTRSGCGAAESAMGPFYCPADERVYLDTEFFDELQKRFKAPGDFARAYVIAHEVGHHVQNLLGTSQKVHEAQQRLGKADANKLSVKLELQADFFAGVWAHHAQRARNIIEEGDVEAALKAANAIGDDKLQRQARGFVVPDSFTHGTSNQRMKWFSLGLKTGDIRQGDTFSAPDL